MSHPVLFLGLVAVTVVHCGDKKSVSSGGKKTATGPGILNLPNSGSGPGGTIAVADTKAQIAVTGTLAVSPGAQLTSIEQPSALLAFPLYRGQFITNELGVALFDALQTFTIDSSGAFSGAVSSLGLSGSLAQKCIGDDGKVNVEHLLRGMAKLSHVGHRAGHTS